jgi:hypothetical protein
MYVVYMTNYRDREKIDLDIWADLHIFTPSPKYEKVVKVIRIQETAHVIRALFPTHAILPAASIETSRGSGRSRDSSVGIAAGYRLNEGRGKRFLFSANCPDRLWGQASCPIRTGCSFCAVKRYVREAGHSLAPSAEVKNDEAVHLLPHMSSWRGA